MKRNLKLSTLILSCSLALTVFSACDYTTGTSETDIQVEISQAEEKIIESMLAEGKDEMEIAEALIAYESEVMATAETSGTTTGTSATNGTTSGTTTGTSATQSTIPTNGNPTGSNGTSATTTSGTTVAPTETTAKPTETTAATTKDYEFKSSMEDECIDLINALRKQYAYDRGKTYYVPLVKTSDAISKAHTRCVEISSNFSHNSASGTSLASECIYQIGTSSTSASTIVNAWKNSSGHYASLLDGCTAKGLASINAAVGVMVIGNTTFAVFGTSGQTSGDAPSSGYVAPTETTAKPTETTAAPTETTAPPETTAAPKPTEKPDPCANGHDWEFTGCDDEYDYFRCTRCGATKKEAY